MKSKLFGRTAVAVLLLALLLVAVLALSACKPTEPTEDPTAAGDYNEEPIVTPTDLEEEFTPDPAATAENETFVSDYSEASARLGVQLAFPAEFEIYRVLLVDQDKVQVEFYYNDVFYLGQYVVGLQENLSGLGGGFTTKETVTLAASSVNLEYTPAVKNAEGVVTAAANKLALAETYNQTTNITAWLVENDFAEIDGFKPVVEMFLLSLTDEYVDEQAPAETGSAA